MNIPAWHELIGWGLAVVLISIGWIAGTPDSARRIHTPRSIAPNTTHEVLDLGEAGPQAA
jgi:hypothetical protein